MRRTRRSDSRSHHDERPLLAAAEGNLAEKRAALRGALFSQEAGLRADVRRNLEELVLYLDACGGAADGCHAFVRTIGNRLGLSRRTVQMLMRRAEAMGLIERRERCDGAGRQTSNEVRVCWPAIRGLSRTHTRAAGGDHEPRTPGDPGTRQANEPLVAQPRDFFSGQQKSRPPAQTCAPPRKSCAPREDSEVTESSLLVVPLVPPPPSESVLALKKEGGAGVFLHQSTEDDAWAELTERIRRSGMHRWPETAALARSSGISAAELLGVIAYYEANRERWRGPGALCERLSHAWSGQPVDAGWPPPSEEWTKQQADHATRDAAAARREEIERERHAALRDGISWSEEFRRYNQRGTQDANDR